MTSTRALLPFLLLAFCFLATSCMVSPETAARLENALSQSTAALDRNNDGSISNRELHDSKSDPNFWIALGGAALGLLGIGGATSAKRAAAHVTAETDDQWERLAKLEAASKTAANLQ